MGRGEEREPEPGLVRARGAHRPGRGGGAEGVRGDLEPRRGARRHGDRLPARQDPGRVARLRAAQARRLLPDHRRQYLPQPARGFSAAETRADQVHRRREAIPAETIEGFSGEEREACAGNAGEAAPGGDSQRECLRGADGRCARVLARADHARAVRSRRPVPPQHVAQDFLSASTALQRSSSERTKLPNSSGEECLATRPMSSKRLRTSAAASAAPSSAFSLRTISRGVRAGANTPPQLAKSYPGMPASIAVGTFGKDALRSGVVTASARSVPALMCPPEAARGSIMKLMRFEIRSGCAAELPL